MRNPFRRTRVSGPETAHKPPRQDGDASPMPDHSAVMAADPYAFQVAHRRLAWTARLLATGFTGSVALNLVLGGAIAEMVPLKRIEPALVRIESIGDRTVPVDPASLVRILPITKETPGFDLVMESFVRRYVRLLREVDPVGHQDRLTEANRYSETDFWKGFVKDKYPEIKKAMEGGLIRSVVIESASRISVRDGVYRWLVAFDEIDTQPGKPPETRKNHAYVAVTARPNTVREAEKFENPLGLRVLNLSVQLRGN